MVPGEQRPRRVLGDHWEPVVITSQLPRERYPYHLLGRSAQRVELIIARRKSDLNFHFQTWLQTQYTIYMWLVVL